MKISIKTLQQQQFTVEVDPNETVAQVKAKIEAQEKHPAAWQKLIYSGKVLDDKATVASSAIKEGEFLVLMVRKPTGKEAAPAQTTTTTTTTTTEQPKPAEAKPAEQKPSPSQTQTPTPAPAPTTAPSSTQGNIPESSLVTGSAYEAMVQQLCDMGFPREDVARALRAAFNNPDRAVEYLFNGIPETTEFAAPTSPTQQPRSPATPQQQQQQQPTISPTTPLIPPQFMQQQQQQSQPTQGGGSGVFDFLRNHPQFNALRMMVQQQPELLQTVLQQLAQTNPAILQLINQNQQEFIQLLNEPVGNMGGGGGSGGSGTPPLSQQYIQVTPEEKAAIDRLEKLGFDRAMVIEAFFACDKDEQLAANYLLENGFADEFDDETSS